MNDKQPGELLAQLLAAAASDADLRRALLADPARALADAGIHLPADVTVAVHEDKPGRLHVVLPPASDPEALDDEQLAISGGAKPSRHFS
jgi:hypothetical protein